MRALRTPIAILAILAGLGCAGDGLALTVEHVPATPASTPFFASFIDLAPAGFVEEEYLVGGAGNVYEYDDDLAVRIATPDVPYKTRILVRRPASAADFNGVVLFEMFNPTAQFDIDFEWQLNRELLLDEGYAWVGLTMKDVAVDLLRAWDPARYGDLSMPDNGLAYDMFAQVAALLRDAADPANPLAGFAVTQLIGTGYSQTADYLTTFSNEFHESARARDGRHAFDGYLLGGGAGAARRINSASAEYYLDERRLNHVAAPLIRVQSETEVLVFLYASTEARQPDSDVFHIYEIAGGSHGGREVLQRTGEVIARDVGGPVLPPCGEPLNELRISPVHRSSLANLVRWIADGTAPPPGRLIELAGPREVVRDAHGNALGGVRLPPIEVPLRRFEPANLGPGPCVVGGASFPFDPPTLDVLYPNHGAYVHAVKQSAADNRRQGYLLKEDAKAYGAEAAHSGVGK